MFALEPIDHLFANSLLSSFKGPFPASCHLFLATLLHASRFGHLCIYLDEKICLPVCEKELHDQLWEGSSHLPSSLLDNEIVHIENRWYLARFFNAEENVIAHLNRLKEISFEEKIILGGEEKLLQEQREAISHVFSHPFTLILGGPGTGKSFTIKALLRLFARENPQAHLAAIAPTGKAASNLRQGMESVSENLTIETIHRFLLGMPACFDLVVVDEASMVDAALMGELMGSLKMGSRLVFVGDNHQLPPVEGGSLFSEMAEREKENTIILQRSFRAQTSEVVELAEKIKQGDLPAFLPLPPYQELIDLIQRRHTDSSSFAALTPFRHGPYGVERLNHHLFQLNRNSEKIPIMITKNDPDLQLANGDLAFLFPKKREAHFFDKRMIPENLLPAYELAYVLSIHKSQGSEYEEVMVLLPESSENFGRELLYTAITRAKKRVTLYAENEKTLRGILANQKTRLTRWSQPVFAINTENSEKHREKK